MDPNEKLSPRLRGPEAKVADIAAERGIKAGQLRKIIEGLKGRPHNSPPDHELSVLAAVLTGIQSCNLPDDWGRGGDFYAHVDAIEGIKGTPARFGDKGPPPQPRLTFDAGKRLIGHPRRKQRKWSDFEPDIAARFQQMMKAANPGQEFRDRDGPVADFVAAVAPLVFPGQKTTAGAVGQRLARRRRKTRARR
jgi:hypothetical protein